MPTLLRNSLQKKHQILTICKAEIANQPSTPIISGNGLVTERTPLENASKVVVRPESLL